MVKFSKTKFKKAAALGLALTLSVSIFAGCGKASDKDDQGRTIISIAEWPTKEGKDLNNMLERKAKFEEANTDVVVEGDPWSFDRKSFYAKAAGGQLPTWYKVGFTEVPEIMAAGYSADLTDVLKKRGYEGKLNEDILKICTDENGKIKALPTDAYVLGIFCNIEMFEAAGLLEEDGTPKQPATWEELAEFAVKIKEATGKAGFVFPTANNCGGWIFTPVAWSYGVDFMEKDSDGKWKATFNTPECVEALQLIKDLKWKYDVLPTNTFIDQTEQNKIIGTGEAAMTTCSGAVANSIAPYDFPKENVGIVGFPAGPKRHVAFLGGSVWCAKADATEDQIDAALRWYETDRALELNEQSKVNSDKNMESQIEKGSLIGIKQMNVYNTNSSLIEYQHKLIDENVNINPNHVKVYNEFVANCPAEIQAEEPVCCQELYGILDNCIQEVFTNKDADCAALIANAASDFQKNYLDNL